jgi:transposase
MTALLPNEFWLLIEPILPPLAPRGPQGGRNPLPPRTVRTGLLFVLRTGIPGDDRPRQLGYGSASTWWRGWRGWQAPGVGQQIHFTRLDGRARWDGWEWPRAVVDSSRVRAVGAGEETGPRALDRGQAGAKRPIEVEGRGTP